MTTSIRSSLFPSETKGGIGPSKKYLEKPRRKSTSDVGTQTIKDNVKEPNLCSEEGCSTMCQSLFKRSKRIFDILIYFRLALALTLYILILVDVIHILTRVINAEFTLFTLFSHPKRLANFPRAIKIYRASRKRNQQLGEDYPLDVKEAQKRVGRAYDWYIYEGDKAFICPPAKLLIVLTFWNIGSFLQYGICAILWFITQQYRPVVIYAALDLFSFLCEVAPIPLVVSQSRRAILARRYAVFEAGRTRLLPHSRYRRSMGI
ncbi:16366_t:CDS:2 [Acaulospora morrowiae]|uniref:16366_t:CDS:1 n=1 Tax=Acaulospora morrowiae TaxID=94023 RepID=A0A9N8V5A4_9GLOM|nr:16366_t:CDS:2 [Acaulospora morrowiae]